MCCGCQLLRYHCSGRSLISITPILCTRLPSVACSQTKLCMSLSSLSNRWVSTLNCHLHEHFAPLPHSPLPDICSVTIVWRIRGMIIRTVQCCTVYHSHMHTQMNSSCGCTRDCWFRFSVGLFAYLCVFLGPVCCYSVTVVLVFVYTSSYFVVNC